MLPFNALTWADFESLQWRVLRDVEGLRHAQFYGEPGQAQRGLDLIAVAADGSGVALQSKRVKQFGPVKISAAVDAFRKTERPFNVSRFIIGVAREIRSTQALDRFRELEKELQPIQLELWDMRELSYKLKGAPHIVIEYFGKDIAEIFCSQFTIGSRTVPRRDVVVVREAIARTPEVTTGAGEKIARAQAQSVSDPAAALKLVEEAQEGLTDAGFAGHAAQHEVLRATLLVTAGRGTEAARRWLNKLWIALDHGHTTAASTASREISSVAKQVHNKSVRDHKAVAERAINLYVNPLASVPNLADLLVGDVLDRARLGALAAETALAGGDYEWLKKNATRLRNIAAAVPTTDENTKLRVRLRILAAEGSGKWAPILGDARAIRLGYDLGGLVKARYARHLALNQKFAEADASWDEAAGDACLAERWTDASRWTLSRRAFRIRWQPFTADDLLPVQTALSAHGPDPTVLTRDEDALEYAYGRLADDQLRSAAISAQRALRDTATLSDWEGERRARRLLADVLVTSGELLMAANHLVLAGETKALERLGADQATPFLDVTPHLDAKPWWIVGAAYRLITAQADLIPDDMVPAVGDHALSELRSARKNTLIDLSGFRGSRYLGAIAALAGISERLSNEQADEVLTYFEAQSPVEPNQYRYHDEDEAKIVAGVLATHATLAERGLKHLVDLLDRSDVSRNTTTYEAVTDRIVQARPHLEELAEAGRAWAQEVLDSENPEEVSTAKVEKARARLEEPLVHTSGVFEIGAGSSSIPDSVLVRTLPVRRQEASLQQLLDRAADPCVSATDRASYLIAASNLRPPTGKARRTEFFERALTLAIAPPESVADAIDVPFQHPLGAVRMNRRWDTRGEAAHLAATLARTRKDQERVRNAALGLIGDEAASEVWVTRALQRLGDTMAPDVGFLSGQNWALRSLSAILWAETTQPDPVGYRLAADADVRVRRALAVHLIKSQASEKAGTLVVSQTGAPEAARRRDARTAILTVLQEDPCFSVRAAAKADR
ncbi:hypothetical protein AZH51_04395 [Branchiibius sp. NY16-3462-2]|nr:hypothetical protein AZH51_04395 [Branchiibius sp. NY16-3462-2]